MSTRQYFSVEISTTLKGIAILFMLFHHSCGFPESIADVGISFSKLVESWAELSFLCVGIYAFLTSYSFYLHQDKSPLYILKKITLFLFDYWIVLLFVYALVLCVFPKNSYTISELVDEIFPVAKYTLMPFSWYVVFYVLVMIFLPYLNISERAPSGWRQITSALLLCFTLCFCLKLFHLKGTMFVFSLFLGHVYAKCDVLNNISAIFCNRSHLQRNLFGLLFLLLFISCVQLCISFSCNPLVSLILIQCFLPSLFLSVVLLYPCMQKIGISRCFLFFGKHSLNIWFLHGLFFSVVTKSLFMPLAYQSDCPLLVVVSILLVCIPLSLLLFPIQKVVHRLWENKIFRELNTH